MALSPAISAANGIVTVEPLVSAPLTIAPITSSPVSVDLLQPVAPLPVQLLAAAKGDKGDKGDTGPSGPDGLSLFFTQAIPSASWLISHNFGRYPVVSVSDVDGNNVGADLRNLDINTLSINFASPFSGTAQLK